jgi:Zn-dependent peptidase ImmA (M78 family)
MRPLLVSKAILSETARQTLEMMGHHFEPEWMFRQAEHFSLCLRIPRDRLLEVLEEGLSLHGWAPIYRLAERFGVSGTMMKTRLEKLRLIEFGPDGKPRPRQPVMQGGLFN